MKSCNTYPFLTGLMAVIVLGSGMLAQARERILWDNDWRFHRGDVAGAEKPSFSDLRWQRVNLPYDWSIEGKTSPDAPGGGAMGYFPTGVGCYRKTFRALKSWTNQRVFLEFDGVYERAEVWINGQSLGLHPYGYTPFHYDLTPYLKFGSKNILFVRVDNSQQPNSRWYSGSGIYRHVWLTVTHPVHFALQNIFVSTPKVSAQQATITVQASVRNQDEVAHAVTVQVQVLDPTGRAAASGTQEAQVPALSETPASLDLTLPSPHLWSPQTPALYTAISRISVDGEVADEVAKPFGIRSINVSVDHGFELNGRPIELDGGNVHADNGPLGAAAFDRAEERKAEILRAAGFNAIRTAHNPPSTAFLAACDRLGLLVIDEAFDGWAKKKTRYDYATVFHDWWQKDLDAMVRRDRNHPSVVMWSIGNEVYERGDASGAEIARQMRECIRRLDTTRPITAGINGLGKSGDWTRLDPLFASLDVAGYNYETARHAADHARLPDRVMMLTETYQSDTFNSWAAVRDNAYVIGDFVWSAFDYLGEAGIGRVFPPGEKPIPHWEGEHYPWHGAACGDIDLTGWRKPTCHYRNIVWDRGEKLYAAVVTPSPNGEEWSLSKWAMPPALPSWTWPGHEGKLIRVVAYSRHDLVRLYLNGILVGQRPTAREQQFKATFDVVYDPGTLRVVGVDEGKEVDEFSLSTAGKAAAILLSPDREQIHADGQDLSFVTVEITDDQGRLRPDAEDAIKYRLRGPGEIIGIGSGDLTSRESYQANPRRVYQGRALVIVRSTGKPGKITLTATGSALAPGKASVSATLKD